MTPKEKSEKLVQKFYGSMNPNAPDCNISFNQAKQCVLIAVEEIIEQWEYIDTYLADLKGELSPNLKYWKEVLNEINKL